MNKPMRLQVIQDSNGKPTGVYIPINEWRRLKKQHRDLEKLEQEEPTKQQILKELKEAVVELQLIEKGKRRARPAKELLDEL
jgi:PHD/YefM family antitoxin component YafN of YafNO toxin-antitoxin module